MLLVWQGRCKQKTWEIDGRRESIESLESALQRYWGSISHKAPKIDDVRVILIDLTKRNPKAQM